MSERYAPQLNEAQFLAAMRSMERMGDDRVVKRSLQSGQARDALRGNVIPRHVYRLECGHLEQIHGTPLPTSTRELFCPDETCRRQRRVVEHLTGR